MKLRPVTKPLKGSTVILKIFDNNVMSQNCYVIVIFPIYGKFGAIRKPDSICMVCKTFIFINSNFLSYKYSKQN